MCACVCMCTYTCACVRIPVHVFMCLCPFRLHLYLHRNAYFHGIVLTGKQLILHKYLQTSNASHKRGKHVHWLTAARSHLTDELDVHVPWTVLFVTEDLRVLHLKLHNTRPEFVEHQQCKTYSIPNDVNTYVPSILRNLNGIKEKDEWYISCCHIILALGRQKIKGYYLCDLHR